LDDVPDAFVRRFTLVVPVVRLQMGGEVEFALGIETVDRSGAFVPPPEVLQSQRIHQLSGLPGSSRSDTHRTD
jgi:hypothetical protein